MGKKANKDFQSLPKGDVISTNADTNALRDWIDFVPRTQIADGMKFFLSWFKKYYQY